MKVKIILLVTLCLVVFASCKKESTESTEAKQDSIPLKENFVINLDIKAAKDDNFAAYYTQDGTINFSGEQAVWSGVKGGNEQQTVEINLPADVLPTHIRLDFGINENQEDVTLSKVKFEYYGKSFEIKGSDFYRYFIQNESIPSDVDTVNGTITFHPVDGKFATPFFYPHQALVDEVARITK